MTRSAAILLGTALWAGAAASALAHHSHPYFYDQCKSVTVEGRVESVQWKDPHSLIVVRRDDGTAYTVDWSGLSQLTRSRLVAPAQASLVVGTRITVTGNPIRTVAQIKEHFPEYSAPGNPNVVDPTSIRRVDNSWTWGAPPLLKPPDCTGK